MPLVLGLQQEKDPRVMTDKLTEENLRRFVLKASIPLLVRLNIFIFWSMEISNLNTRNASGIPSI